MNIRRRVFQEEQGIAAELERDEYDATSLHVLAFDGDQAIGTGRLLPDAHMGRIAVLPEYRKHGAGRQIVLTLNDLARQRGDSAVHLSSQESAIGFYRRLGFVAHGEMYMEAGIPHLSMTYTF